ncbi:APC family permease [Coxiella endosymbiont of Amblyomma sculptum]|uniref:APC family permease n=1 Tax=Coxiella endosymbiont of Amblyomma sculptum TaxID=2487929 RepID=UPI00132EA8C8|nr:APC family permease [Coxiella endosymbiont of Amblyomma sculptum]QHG92619.1 APC family permease [Coxiella endosymbiont of Amblyomma sculptum]
MNSTNAYRRRIGPIDLMMSSVSAMIGSGWLFSSLYVGRLAGPASIIAWIFGGLLVVIVALTYAEITTMLPITGGSTRFPQLTHGTFVSLFFGWITWFNLMTAPATEVQAMVQYAANYCPSLIRQHGAGTHGLSFEGYLIATFLMVGFSLINIYSIRFTTSLNNIFSFWKLVVPVLTACVLMAVSFHPHNFSNFRYGGFMPNGWKGVFAALATGGILFAFNGFKQAVELAGEADNPSRTVMIAILGSLSVVLIIYLLLQIGFIGALSLDSLSKGWLHVHFTGDAGPLAGLLMVLGITWMAILLYFDALVATSAAGLVYSTSAARTLYGLSANRQLPKFLHEVNKRGIPAKAIVVNFIVSMTFFLPFQGWYAMAEFMSSIIALSYITGPICCLSLRYQLPNHKRIFRLPLVTIWSFIGFYICTLIVYWTGWNVVSKLGISLVVSLVLFIVYRLFSERPRGIYMNWCASLWMWPYLVGLSVISYLGSYGGGCGKIPFGWDFLYLGILSVVSLHLAVLFRASDKHVRITLSGFEEEVATGIPSTVPNEN